MLKSIDKLYLIIGAILFIIVSLPIEAAEQNSEVPEKKTEVSSETTKNQKQEKKSEKSASLDPEVLMKKIEHLEEELKNLKPESRSLKEFGFTPHKPNYLLPYTYTDHNKDRKSQEAKFQLSFKQRLFGFWDHFFYFAYSQKSFWQAYDKEDSRPFRETNYNPEIFARSKKYSSSDGWSISWDLGIEHESNGARIETSRSWNRAYITPRIEYSDVLVEYKMWARFKEKKKDSPDDPVGDENPDIEDYLGKSQLRIELNAKDFWFAYTGRRSFETGRGSMQLDFAVPNEINSASLHLQYFNGYGESLIDYNQHITKVGIGMMFTH